MTGWGNGIKKVGCNNQSDKQWSEFYNFLLKNGNKYYKERINLYKAGACLG